LGGELGREETGVASWMKGSMYAPGFFSAAVLLGVVFVLAFGLSGRELLVPVPVPRSQAQRLVLLAGVGLSFSFSLFVFVGDGVLVFDAPATVPQISWLEYPNTLSNEDDDEVGEAEGEEDSEPYPYSLPFAYPLSGLRCSFSGLVDRLVSPEDCPVRV
jgi:hypothetical protein